MLHYCLHSIIFRVLERGGSLAVVLMVSPKLPGQAVHVYHYMDVLVQVLEDRAFILLEFRLHQHQQIEFL